MILEIVLVVVRGRRTGLFDIGAGMVLLLMLNESLKEMVPGFGPFGFFEVVFQFL